MKKFLTIFALVLALCLTCAFALAADDDSDSEFDGVSYETATRIHELDGHDVDFDRIVEEPTCTGKGIARYTCITDGSHFHEVFIAPKGHTWGEWESDSEPTCTENGREVRVCTVCGKSEARTINALGHLWSSTVDGENWGRVTVKPTCTSEGAAEDFCLRCDVVNNDILPRVIKPIDHKLVEVIDYDPTCMDEGQKHQECEVCGYIDEDTYEDIDIDPEAHDWDAWVTVKAATCAEEGEMLRWCKRCGDKQEKAIEILEADFQPIKESKRLIDCYQMEITTTYRCANCDGKDFGGDIGVAHEDYTETETVDVVSHVFKFEDEYILEEQDPTCEEDGYVTYKCVFYDDVDGHEDDEEAVVTFERPALGHKWGNPVLRVRPGEGENEYGYWLVECERCHKHKEIIARFLDEECAEDAHEWAVIDKTPASCTSEGSITYQCNLCGKVKVETVEMVDHVFELVDEVAPTCTEAGYSNYVCVVCGEPKVEEGEPATGHTPQVVPAVDATAEATGLTEGVVCAVCGEVLVAQEEIPALAETHYSIERDGSKYALTLDEGAKKLDESYVRIVATYTLSNGDTFSTYNIAQVMEKDGEFYARQRMDEPAGATLQFIFVEVVDDDATLDMDTGSYDNYGKQIF